MRIAVTGSSGLVGTALLPCLEGHGHDLVRFVRREATGEGEIQWDPETGIPEPGHLEGLDGVVHLAGKSIAEGRWGPAQKEEIRNSRVLGTGHLSRALASLARTPRVLVSASAVGYYGDRKDEVLTEESAPGDDFLAGVCRDWEDATLPAGEAGIRIVRLRIGAILSADGGALAKMLPVFRLGLGGRIGNGRQYMSWICIDDLIEVIRLALEDDSLEGPVNAVSPNPVTNRDFARALGRVLSRPARFSVPPFVARAAFGEMADELLLAGQRVKPERLQEAKFPFQYPDLEAALHHLLDRPA